MCKEKTASCFGSGFFEWVRFWLFEVDVCVLVFLCGDNGLRETIVTDVLFVFEHFFYSVLNVSYKALKVLSIRLCSKRLCITLQVVT